MSKTPSQDLFLLIKSLNKNEKGYIKKTAFLHTDGATNFLRLFDAIDKQEIYDDRELRKNEIYVRQLPRLKNYLYEKILAALEIYHAGKNKDIKIRQTLSRIQILFQKGFYSQCSKLLSKTKHIAIKEERFSQLLDILEWERILVIENLSVENINRIDSQESLLLKKLQNLNNYKTSYDQVSLLYTKTIVIRNESEHSDYKKIVTREFKDERKAESLTAKVLQLKTIGKYLSALDDRKNYLKIARKAAALMERNPDYIDAHLIQYVKVLNNLIVTLGENGKHKEWASAIARLRAIPKTYPSADNEWMESNVFMRSMVREFYYYQNQGDFRNAYKLIPKIKDGLEKYGFLISKPHRLIFYYAISYSNFIMGELKTALEWINKIINDRVAVETRAFHHFARMLNLVIHLELGNFDLLEYLVRSYKRFLAKEKKYYMLEGAFISFLEEVISSSKGEADFFKKLISFRDKILNMPDPLEYNAFEYFDFISWIRCKLDKKSYSEILTKKRIKSA